MPSPTPKRKGVTPQRVEASASPEMVALPPFELLRVEGLHASYDGPTEVLHGVSIEVREHEIVTVLARTAPAIPPVAAVTVCGTARRLNRAPGTSPAA